MLNIDGDCDGDGVGTCKQTINNLYLISVKHFYGNMDAQISAAFSRLQPLCVRLAREHTRDNVTMVMRELESIECKEVMQQLQEYVLFPLRLILKQPEQRYIVCTLFFTTRVRSRTGGYVFTGVCLLTGRGVPHGLWSQVLSWGRVTPLSCHWSC